MKYPVEFFNMRRTPKNFDLEADKVKTTIGLQACPGQILLLSQKRLRKHEDVEKRNRNWKNTKQHTAVLLTLHFYLSNSALLESP
jgi:hypothetical protein